MILGCYGVQPAAGPSTIRGAARPRCRIGKHVQVQQRPSRPGRTMIRHESQPAVRAAMPAPGHAGASPLPTVEATEAFNIGAWVASRLGCDPEALQSKENDRQGRDHSEVRRYWLGARPAATVTLSATRRNLSGDDRRLLVLVSPQGTDYRGLEPGIDVIW